MGANEKHAATYHGGEYTPTTDELRDIWVDYNLNPLPRSQGISLIETAQADFTRWLDQIRAEAKAEALDEYADAIQHVDDVIQRQAESDDRWTDFQDAEREFTRNDGGMARDYYTAATHYARYRANQYKENQS